MPIYVYECLDCLGEWKESHGMTEDIDECNWCHSANFHRKPSQFTNLTKLTQQKRKIGDITKEFIENSKEVLKTHKEELGNKR